MTFNWQYGKVLLIVFCGRFFISNDVLPNNGKTQANSFFGTIQIFGCLINTLSKYIFMSDQKNLSGTRHFEKLVLISEFQNAELYKKSKS